MSWDTLSGWVGRKYEEKRPYFRFVGACIWLILAALLGLVFATIIVSGFQPLLEGIIRLVGVVDGLVQRAWLGFSAWSGTPPHEWNLKPLKEDAAKITGLGFGVLGGSILLTTIRDTVAEVTDVVKEWRDVKSGTVVSASTSLAVSFLAIGLSVYGLRSFTLPDSDGLLVSVHPVFMQDSEAAAVLPVFFKNAELKSDYWEEEYIRETEPIPIKPEDEKDIWKTGVTLDNEALDLNKFLSALRRCALRASPETPIHLQVVGYASSREFFKAEVYHPQSNSLNVKLANDRARKVHEVVKVVSSNDVLFKVDEVKLYRTLQEMHDDRLYIDRLEGEELKRQEDLARRADIVVASAPGCKGISVLSSSGKTLPAGGAATVYGRVAER